MRKDIAIGCVIVALLVPATSHAQDPEQAADPDQEIPVDPVESPPDEETASERGGDESPRDAEPSVDQPPAVGRDEQTVPGNGTAEESDDHQHDLREIARSDLAAQESMAAATDELVELGWYQLAAGIAGAVLLLWTLLQTRKSTDAAVRAATAAEANIYSNRAWMCLSGFSTAPFKDGWIDGVHFDSGFALSVQLRNMGLSPALQCDVYRGLRIVKMSDDIPEFERSNTKDLRSATVGPQQTVSSPMMAITDSNVNDLLSGHARVFIYVHISYHDIYATTPMRHTEVCGEMQYTGDEQHADGVIRKRFDLSPLGPQNTTS